MDALTVWSHTVSVTKTAQVELGSGRVTAPAVVVGGQLEPSAEQGLTLVHYSAQPEPFLSLELDNYSTKKCLC